MISLSMFRWRFCIRIVLKWIDTISNECCGRMNIEVTWSRAIEVTWSHFHRDYHERKRICVARTCQSRFHSITNHKEKSRNFLRILRWKCGYRFLDTCDFRFVFYFSSPLLIYKFRHKIICLLFCGKVLDGFDCVQRKGQNTQMQ